jgi:hypothetical protein
MSYPSSHAIRVFVAGVLSVACFHASQVGLAAEHARMGARTVFRPATDRAARESAIRSVPFEKLDPETRSKISVILSRDSVFRRLPAQVVPCDPELYAFTVRHPDVIVNLWRILGISKIMLKQTGPDTFQYSDGEGTTGTIEYLFENHDTHLAYTTCVYDGPLWPNPITYQGVLILKSGFIRETDGRYYVTTRLDTFSSITPGGIELLTKTFMPWFGKVADSNFAQTAAFIGGLSSTAEQKPNSLRRVSYKLTMISEDTRRQFADLATKVASKAQPEAAASSAPIRRISWETVVE